MAQLFELLQLAALAYTERDHWRLWRRESTSPARGCHSFAWRDDRSGDVVLSFRGTAGVHEIVQDLALLFGREPRAWRRGRVAVHEARRLLGSNGRLYLTGHSIGGALASTLAAEQGIDAVTFNAPGTFDALRRSHRTLPPPAWLETNTPRILEVGLRADWIQLLSGPTLGQRRLVGPGPLPAAPHGGLGAALRHLRRSWKSSMEGHALSSLRRLADEGRSPWHTDVGDLLRGSALASSSSPNSRNHLPALAGNSSSAHIRRLESA